MNLASILILAAVVALVAVAFWLSRRRKRKGCGGCCGCDCSSSCHLDGGRK